MNNTHEKIHTLKINDGTEIEVFKCSLHHHLFLKRTIKDSCTLFRVDLDLFISFKNGLKNLLEVLEVHCNYKDLLDSLKGTDLRVITTPLSIDDKMVKISFKIPYLKGQKTYLFEIERSDVMSISSIDSTILIFKDYDSVLFSFSIGSFSKIYIADDESIIQNVDKLENIELNKELAKVFLMEHLEKESNKLRETLSELNHISKNIN